MRFFKIIILSFASMLFLTISVQVKAFNQWEAAEALPEIEVNLDVFEEKTVEPSPVLRFPEYKSRGASPQIRLIQPQAAEQLINLKPVEAKKAKPISLKRPKEKVIRPIAKPKVITKDVSLDNTKEKVEAKVDTKPVPLVAEIEEAKDLNVIIEEETKISEVKVELEKDNDASNNMFKNGEAETSSLSESDVVATEFSVKPPQTIDDGIFEISIMFEADSSLVSEANEKKIKAVAASLKTKEESSLRLMSYAKGDEPSSSRSRRLSLSRALAVRSKLMDFGIRSTRIEVRALGNVEESNNQDRMDLYIIKR